ncbi:hypothetical protein [Desulfosediminicola flagellatus]|nr:hypothetical protein [Desulfosediminicola flagellatus]
MTYKERKQDRIRERFKSHTQLNQKDSELYRDTNCALKHARELAAEECM